MNFFAVDQTRDFRGRHIDQRRFVANLLDHGVINNGSANFVHDVCDPAERRNAVSFAAAKPYLGFYTAHVIRIVFYFFSPMGNCFLREPVYWTPWSNVSQACENISPWREPSRHLFSALPPSPQGKQLPQSSHIRHGQIESSTKTPVRSGLPFSAPTCIELVEILIGLKLDFLRAEKLKSIHAPRKRVEVNQ